MAAEKINFSYDFPEDSVSRITIGDSVPDPYAEGDPNGTTHNRDVALTYDANGQTGLAPAGAYDYVLYKFDPFVYPITGKSANRNYKFRHHMILRSEVGSGYQFTLGVGGTVLKTVNYADVNKLIISEFVARAGSSGNIDLECIPTVAGSLGIAAAFIRFLEIDDAPVPTITTLTVPGATIGTAYNQTLAVVNGIGTIVWSKTSGTLPPGITFNTTTHKFEGTPTTAGTYPNIIIRAAGSDGVYDERTYSITTVDPDLSPTITTASVPSGTVGTAYNQTLAVTSGDGAITWSKTSGTLPPGISFNTATHKFEGTPTTAGTYPSIVIRATDADGDFDEETYSIVIAEANTAPTITTTSVPSGVIATAYSQLLSSTSGNGTKTWSKTSGALPNGISFNAGTHTFEGTPTKVGTFPNIVIRVTDADGDYDEETYSIVIRAAAAPVTVQILCEGDSRIEGNTGVGYETVAPADTFPSRLAALIPANSSRYDTPISSNGTNTVLVKNIGLGGTTTAQHVADQQAQIDNYYDALLARNIVISAATINDFNSGANPGWTISSIYNARKAVYDDLVSKGQEVYVGTIITTTNGTPTETLNAIQSVNTLLRNNIPGSKLIDWAADSRLANPDNTTYFQDDKLHLKPAGNQAMAEVAFAKIFDTTAPSAPVLGAVTNSNVGVYIAFTPAADGESAISSLTFYRSTDNFSTQTTIPGANNVSPFVDTSAPKGVPVKYRAQAINTVPLTSAMSNEVSGQRWNDAPTISTSATLGSIQQSVSTQFTIATTGGDGTRTLSAPSGLPSGISLAGGIITINRSTLGAFSFDLRVTDINGQNTTKTFNGTIFAPVDETPTITTGATLPTAYEEIPYVTQLAATGGEGTRVWSLVNAVAGITLSASGLVTYANPTAQKIFTARVTDENGAPSGESADRTFTIPYTDLVPKLRWGIFRLVGLSALITPLRYIEVAAGAKVLADGDALFVRYYGVGHANAGTYELLKVALGSYVPPGTVKTYDFLIAQREGNKIILRNGVIITV